MRHSIAPIAFKPPRLKGLSENMTVSHYENNYGGAVRRLNAIENQLMAIDWSGTPGYLLNGLKREQLLAGNSMILHEVYFDSLGGVDGLGGGAADSPAGDLADAITRDFGSVDQWHAQFSAMGKALAGGSGWVILSWSPRKQRLENQWAADHGHAGADGIPVLALDMYEHSYQMDYGADAASYVDAYTANLHWGRAAVRFDQATNRYSATSKPDSRDRVSPEMLQELIAEGESPVLLDICLIDDLPKRRDQLPGAICLKSDEVSQSINSLATDKPVVAYCMYGFQVSAFAANTLRENGYDVKILAGGIAAWRAIGGKTEPYTL